VFAQKFIIMHVKTDGWALRLIFIGGLAYCRAIVDLLPCLDEAGRVVGEGTTEIVIAIRGMD